MFVQWLVEIKKTRLRFFLVFLPLTNADLVPESQLQCMFVMHPSTKLIQNFSSRRSPQTVIKISSYAASCHLSGAQNFKVAPTFLRKFVTQKQHSVVCIDNYRENSMYYSLSRPTNAQHIYKQYFIRGKKMPTRSNK